MQQKFLYRSVLLSVVYVVLFTNCRPLNVQGQPASATNTAGTVAVISTDTIAPQPDTLTPENSTIPAALDAPNPQATITKTFLPIVEVATETPPVTGKLIADNSVIAQFNSIPASAFTAAKAIDMTFYHQSTGGIIEHYWEECIHGTLEGAPAECATYNQNINMYTWADWNWQEWPTPLADSIAKMDQFSSLVPSQQNADVIGMKYCYVDAWNQDFEYYRSEMEALETAHPNQVFIWATMALRGDAGSTECSPSNPFNHCLNISEFNQQIRVYAAEHNKPFFDIASIESDGGACTVAGYEGMCSPYYEGGGGHPTALGSIRIAKGFWWLMARLGGWEP